MAPLTPEHIEKGTEILTNHVKDISVIKAEEFVAACIEYEVYNMESFSNDQINIITK